MHKMSLSVVFCLLICTIYLPQVEAVYYFAVGEVPEDMKHLLLQKFSDSPFPIHPVSFNAREEDTIVFLKELGRLTSGRYGGSNHNCSGNFMTFQAPS